MNILILGATSSIARACAAEFAARGDNLYLASRDVEELTRIATDLRIRYNVKVNYGEFDADDLNSHKKFWQQALQTMKKIDGVLVAFGYLGDNQQSQQIIISNFSGAVSILNICADYLAEQKQGFIIGLGSVAGDRGRQSNYVYGSAKAALHVYLQGLRNRLHASHIKVLTVKLGFVDTAMTFDLPRLFLVAQPKTVAQKILRALNNGRNVVYIPWFWCCIMFIIKSIPEALFKRLKL